MHRFLFAPVLCLLVILPFSLLADEPDYPTEIRYLYVQPGQTLHNIVRRLYPARQKEWPRLRRQIVRENPHAFVNGDETRMKAGVRLTLPKKMVIRPERIPPRKRKPVGEVRAVHGRVIAVDRNKLTRRLAVGSQVHIGDKLITGENGYLRLRMIDKAVLELRCYSIMVIEDYVLKTGSRRSILNLLQGSLRKVTGSIGKLTGDVYELRTPLANVGVRGTEYALRVYQAKGCGGKADADDSLYLKVIKGLVDVHNDAGHVVVAKGQTAYVPLPPKKAPPPKPRLETVKPGIIEPAPAEEEEEGAGHLWWWLLGVALIAIAL